MSRRQATLFFLIGEMTALSTMWELWRNARMERSTPWRVTLGMPAVGDSILWEVALFLAMAHLLTKKRGPSH